MASREAAGRIHKARHPAGTYLKKKDAKQNQTETSQKENYDWAFELLVGLKKIVIHPVRNFD